MKVAAVADLHARVGKEARVAEVVRGIAGHADVLLLPGDLTDHGRIEEAEVVEEALRGIDVPVLAVLGNHDHESGAVLELMRVLVEAGVTFLDRAHAVVDGVGFAGAKGFCGGFDERIIRAFGEDALKAFVGESVAESNALRNELEALPRGPRVAVTHFAPVVQTLAGEPPEIHPFLGTSRLAAAIDEGGADLAVHGHAHHGSPNGATSGGVPVHNVALPVLQRELGTTFRVFDVKA